MQKDDAERIADLARAAFPADAVDVDGIESVLVDVDVSVGLAVMTDWVHHKIVHPTPQQVADECHAETTRRTNRARAIKAGAENGKPGFVCTACHGDGWEWHDLDEDTKKRSASYAAVQEVLPCRACKPVLHKHWAEGHVAPEHDFLACEWPMCKARAERGEKRGKVGTAKGEQRGGAPVDRRYEKQGDDVGPGF